MLNQARDTVVGRKRSSQVVCFSARHFRGKSEIHGVTWNGRIKLQEGSICKVIVAKGYVWIQDTQGMWWDDIFILLPPPPKPARPFQRNLYFADLAWFCEAEWITWAGKSRWCCYVWLFAFWAGFLLALDLKISPYNFTVPPTVMVSVSAFWFVQLSPFWWTEPEPSFLRPSMTSSQLSSCLNVLFFFFSEEFSL